MPLVHVEVEGTGYDYGAITRALLDPDSKQGIHVGSTWIKGRIIQIHADLIDPQGDPDTWIWRIHLGLLPVRE
jgi:hypothetical protein